MSIFPNRYYIVTLHECRQDRKIFQQSFPQSQTGFHRIYITSTIYDIAFAWTYENKVNTVTYAQYYLEYLNKVQV